MVESTASEPTPGPEVRELDSLYKSFPSFADWPELDKTPRDLWERVAERLAATRQEADAATLERAVNAAVRAAALDTGAIEGLYSVDRGFTMSVAVQHVAQQMFDERSADLRSLFEAQLEAYELVIDAVTGHRPVTEMWIRSLHEKLCSARPTYRVLTSAGWQEQALPLGQYKERPNHVLLQDGSFHPYAPVDQVPSEMHRLVETIGSPEFERAHPVRQASWAHYAFVTIHPFADGNGRVARALASLFFYRALSVPMIVFADHRAIYLEALRVADRGDTRPFVRFSWDRGIETMQFVGERLLEAKAPDPTTVVDHLSRQLYTGRGVTLPELGDTVLRLLGDIELLFRTEHDRLSQPAITLKTKNQDWPVGAPPGYRRNVQAPERALRVELRAAPPAQASVNQTFRVLVAEDESNPFTFLAEAHGSPDTLELRLDDVHPVLTEAARQRLASWVRRHQGRLLASLIRSAEGSLGRFG